MSALAIVDGARKHGVANDIRHAWRNALRRFVQEYDGEKRLAIIGPARDGALLELVVVEADKPTRIIHAAPMRPRFIDALR